MIKPFYVLAFRIAVWVSTTALGSFLSDAWAWAIHHRCIRVMQWSIRRWARRASKRERDAIGLQLRDVLQNESEADRG